VKMCKMMMEVDTRGEWRRGNGGGREWWQGHTVSWHWEKCGRTSRDCQMLTTIWKTIFRMTFHLCWKSCILTTSGIITLWWEKLICALNPKTTSYTMSDARSQFFMLCIHQVWIRLVLTLTLSLAESVARPFIIICANLIDMKVHVQHLITLSPLISFTQVKRETSSFNLQVGRKKAKRIKE
jgi:hypothetical protein